MPRRQGVRGGSTRADGTLVQGAATAFGPTASVGAGVAQGFQSTFMDTFKYVKAEKDKDYARVEEEFYNRLLCVREIHILSILLLGNLQLLIYILIYLD